MIKNTLIFAIGLLFLSCNNTEDLVIKRIDSFSYISSERYGKHMAESYLVTVPNIIYAFIEGREAIDSMQIDFFRKNHPNLSNLDTTINSYGMSFIYNTSCAKRFLKNNRRESSMLDDIDGCPEAYSRVYISYEKLKNNNKIWVPSYGSSIKDTIYYK